MSGLIDAQIAGYAWALRSGEALDDWAVRDAAHEYALAQGVTDNERERYFALTDAFERGALDGTRIAGTELVPGVDYLSTEEAARRKGVARETIVRLLRDAARREAIFPGAIMLGVGRRGIWHVPAGEVEAWQPRRPGRPRAGA